MQHERASSAIDEAFESYHRCLDEARVAMQTELDRVRDEMEKQLHTICENVDRNVGKISDAVKYVERDKITHAHFPSYILGTFISLSRSFIP